MKNKPDLKFFIYIICLTMVLCLFGGCAGTDSGGGSDGGSDGLSGPNGSGDSAGRESGGGGLKVVVTMFPPYDFVRQISKGTDIELQMLIKPGAESHSFDPTAQDIISIRDCDLFIYTGGENDSWVDDILDSFDQQINTLRMMDFAVLVEEETVEGMYTPGFSSHEHEHDAEEEEWDEHVWTSPLNAVNIIEGISDKMSDILPENADLYAANAREYVNALNDLDEQFRSVINASKRHTLIFADRFPARYFTEEFGLDYYAAFPGCSAEAEPSAATVAFLIDKVKEEDIPVVFYIELSDERMADTVCEATGAKKLRFHSCHNVTKSEFESGETYLSLMTKNLSAISQALN